MRLIAYQVENYMKVRLLEVKPKTRITQITGKCGTGKTSAVRALFDALRGKRAQAEMPVRNGAERARIWVGLGEKEKIELNLRLSILPNGSRTLTLETAAGARLDRPQEIIDQLTEQMPGDPLEFMRMEAKQQIDILRKIVKLDVDFDAITADNDRDYKERTEVNKYIKRLQSELEAMTVQQGLPKEKLDELPVREKMAAVTQLSQEARQLDQEKARLEREVNKAAEASTNNELWCSRQYQTVEKLKVQLAEAEQALRDGVAAQETYEAAHDAANEAWANAPAGVYPDASALAAELEQIQLTNREIDKRVRRDEVEARLVTAQREAAQLTRTMERRIEEKDAALSKAKMPVDGLTFDEREVRYKGIPLAQLGEAEALRVCCQVFMSGKQKLRILPIWHGEALDDDALMALETLCEEYDYSILMARVDTSGKVGIVMEDGEGHQVAT